MSKYVSKYAREIRAKERKELEIFADNLTKLLVSLGLKQSDVARKMWPGRTIIDSRNYVAVYGRDRLSAWCNAKARPSPINMHLLCRVLGVKVESLWPGYDWLIGEEETEVVSTAPKSAIVPETLPAITYESTPFGEDVFAIKSINRLVSGKDLTRIFAILADADLKKEGKPANISDMLSLLDKKVASEGRRLVYTPAGTGKTKTRISFAN